MTKDEYGDLLAEIGGGSQIGIAARLEREAAERATIEAHEAEIWTLLCLGDAVHQFYRDTLGVVAERIPVVRLDEAQSAMAYWHVASFNRFAAAFDLMAHGYYFEAMVLARDLWELGLSLAALRRNVVNLEELLPTRAATLRKAEELSRKVDQKIRRALLTENLELSSTARDAAQNFLGIANVATHKSKLHLGRSLSRMLKQQPTLIFPHFDPEIASAAHNVLYLGAWSIVSTLPYLDFALSADVAPGWESSYRNVQLAFREGISRGPNPVVQAWPEIIRHVFVA